MDKFLESLVNDGLPPAGQEREDALFLMLASLVQAQTQTAQQIARLGEAISQLAMAIVQEDVESQAGDPAAITGWGGLDG